VRARAAADEALARARDLSGVDRALIEAQVARYAAAPRTAALDSAYANAMRDVYEGFPNDDDVATLFAEALMVLRPWGQWSREGEAQPGTQEILAVLERTLARNIAHAGACHLYIHAVESSPEPGRAAACAELLMASMPGASHLRHMPSHTWVRIGRWGDAVRANQNAVIADRHAGHGGPDGVYPSHNQHMLSFSAAFDGQSAVALQAARDLDGPGAMAYALPMTLVRFGRWREATQVPRPTHRYAMGTWHFARGMAFLRLGQADSAETARAELAAAVADAGDARFRDHPLASLLGMASAILEGEIHAAAGRFDEAIAALAAGVVLEDALDYDEPEPWAIPVRHVVGAIQLAAGKAADAEATFRAELADHPHNGWSLAGLAAAVEAQGRAREAAEFSTAAERAWARADVMLPRGRF
jgi:tetratricopeptide (TPR) repeat protein